jgi:hypothetical protein
MMNPSRLGLLIAALVIAPPAVTACSGGSPGTPTRVPRSGHGPITGEELQRLPASDLYTAIRTLRPGWLRVGENARVFQGPAARGSVSDLRNILTSDVEMIEFLTPTAAMGRYGVEGQNGVFLVTFRTS